MRLPLITILLLLPTLALAVPSKHILVGKVVEVTDGNTITVLTAGNQEERIRLWGIDAPEKRGGATILAGVSGSTDRPGSRKDRDRDLGFA